MLAFGIVAGCKRLHVPDYPMSSIEDVYRTLNSLDPSCRASKKVRDVRGIEPSVTFGFSDLIPLAAPIFRIPGSIHIHLPTPSEYCVGLTCHQEGFVVFHHRLKEHISNHNGRIPDLRVWVLQQYERLQTRYVEWEDEIEANMNGGARSIEFLDDCHSRWEECTRYFEQLQSSKRPLVYLVLVAAHIKHAVNYWGDAWEHLRREHGKQPHDHYGLRDWIAEGAHMYWEYLPDITKVCRFGALSSPSRLVLELLLQRHVLQVTLTRQWKC